MSSDMTTPRDQGADVRLSLLSARQRLATSRSELVRHMSGDFTLPVSEADLGEHREASSPKRKKKSAGFLGNWDLVKLGISSWWRHHPANVAVQVAAPLFHQYAERRPFQLLAISAGLGAGFVLLKPWRLVSVGGLTVAALKSSEFSALVASLLSRRQTDEDLTDQSGYSSEE